MIGNNVDKGFQFQASHYTMNYWRNGNMFVFTWVLTVCNQSSYNEIENWNIVHVCRWEMSCSVVYFHVQSLSEYYHQNTRYYIRTNRRTQFISGITCTFLPAYCNSQWCDIHNDINNLVIFIVWRKVFYTCNQWNVFKYSIMELIQWVSFDIVRRLMDREKPEEGWRAQRSKHRDNNENN